MEQPKVGDDIYISSAYYVRHGVDDFRGGLCRIVKIKDGKSMGMDVPFIEVAERPGCSYNLNHLLENQEELKKKHGKRRGKKTPDYNPTFNEWSGVPLDTLLEKCKETGQKVEFYDIISYLFSR